MILFFFFFYSIPPKFCINCDSFFQIPVAKAAAKITCDTINISIETSFLQMEQSFLTNFNIGIQPHLLFYKRQAIKTFTWSCDYNVNWIHRQQNSI